MLNKKLIFKYILLFVPFISGSVLIGLGIYNIVSALLFFGGGYIGIKNLCDYRLLRKNIGVNKNEDRLVVPENVINVENNYVPVRKNKKRGGKVRKRVK